MVLKSKPTMDLIPVLVTGLLDDVFLILNSIALFCYGWHNISGIFCCI